MNSYSCIDNSVTSGSNFQYHGQTPISMDYAVCHAINITPQQWGQNCERLEIVATLQMDLAVASCSDLGAGTSTLILPTA